MNSIVLNLTLSNNGEFDFELLSDNKTQEIFSEIQKRSINFLSVIFASLYALTLVVGILTNCLVVVVFIFKSELRQFTNYFFANLSVADILVLIVCIPVAISDLFSPDIWHFGAFYCKMYYFIEYCVTSVSSLTIIFISLERYFAISKPLSVKLLFNEKNSLITIIFIWLVGISISIPFLLMVEFAAYPAAQCHLNMTMVHVVYVFVLNVLLIFVPTIGLTFLYIYIIIKLRKHYKLFNRQSTGSNDVEYRIHSKNSIRIYCNNNNNKNNNNNDINKQTRKSNLQNHSSKSLSSASDERSKQLKRSNSNPQKTNISGSLNKKNNSHNCKKIKSSKSCSLCFSGLNSRYECRCEIGRNKIPSKYLNNNNNCNNIVVFYKNLNGNSKNNNTCLTKVAQNKNQFFHDEKIINNNTCITNNTTNLNKLTVTVPKTLSDSTYSKVNFTIVISLVTLAFFCCQLPLRIFLLWSYLKHYISPPLITLDEQSAVKNEIDLINVISNSTTLIYFLHCISNPIIYNLLSIKFRRAFLSLGVSNKFCLFKFSCKNPCKNRK